MPPLVTVRSRHLGVAACARMEVVKEEPPLYRTIRRRSDEPKLQIGETVSLKAGTGKVVARYKPSGGQDEICYVVEILSDEGEKGRSRKP